MSEPLRAGTMLGQYRIVAPLGAGGMGEVFKAHDTKLDRPVALKLLPPSVARDPDRIRRFALEARSISALSHPNLVTIYDVDQAVPTDTGGGPPEGADAVPFISMELIDGQTLRQIFESRSADLRTTAAYLAQAADGLAKAHATGVVHRDIKPENVMVSRDGYAKILDFGLAKLTESTVPPSISSLETAVRQHDTGDGVVVGTVGYMSPEQVEGRPVDSRTDVFAFGCLL
jgi:eukaryotic-like serine/threonine-protein kinase